MLTTETHIPLDEFERNPTLIFRRVTDEHVTLVVEDDAGRKMVVRPVETGKPVRRSRKKTKADYDAFRASAGSWKDVDTDALIKQIYESRSISTRPVVKL